MHYTRNFPEIPKLFQNVKLTPPPQRRVLTQKTLKVEREETSYTRMPRHCQLEYSKNQKSLRNKSKYLRYSKDDSQRKNKCREAETEKEGTEENNTQKKSLVNESCRVRIQLSGTIFCTHLTWSNFGPG